MILKGRPVAEKIYAQIKKPSGQKKSLAVILVGEDPASLTYIKIKEKIAAQLGFGFVLYHLSGITSEKEILKLLDALNQNQTIAGIVVQLPLPIGLSTKKIINRIAIKKDIDGFLGKFQAPTAQAILEILKFYKIDIKNKKIVIVGYGQLVGQPIEKLLKKQGLKPIICDSETRNLKEKTLLADILISAAGVPGLITSDMVKSETVVIDAGTSEAKGKMVGDVAKGVYQKIKTYTPTPGGVGPVTVACLMRNLAKAAKKRY